MHRFSQDACCCRRRGASVASLRAGLQLLAALICHGCQVPLPCTIMVSTRIPTSQPASLIGNGIMKAKSVYNNMKQQSRSCGIEDNASFAPTNGRDRTDRQDRQTYRHRTKQPRTMYCLCLAPARKLVLYAHTGHQNYAFHRGYKHLTMNRLKYGPHTSQVPTILRYQIYTLDCLSTSAKSRKKGIGDYCTRHKVSAQKTK